VVAGKHQAGQAVQELYCIAVWPDAAVGGVINGVRCEDLQALTFADESIDLHITQDVFEHLLDPRAAFREIARTLRVEGAHILLFRW
jgi:SAM-dependent methyltransferase